MADGAAKTWLLVIVVAVLIGLASSLPWSPREPPAHQKARHGVWVPLHTSASAVRTADRHHLVATALSATASLQHDEVGSGSGSGSGSGEQVGIVEGGLLTDLLTSPWESGQFNLAFNVQAEEISDDEWRQMMTEDLKRHGVLGQIVDRVPDYILNVDYDQDACVHMGNQLGPSQTLQRPLQVNFPTGGRGADGRSGGLFTLMAIDPDVPSQNNTIYGQFLHWLVVNIPDEDIERGDVLAEYLGPLPSQRGGEHRFVFLAHRQPDGRLIETSGMPHAEPCDWAARARFSAAKFAELHGLGRPVAINYFTTRYDPSVPRSIEQCLLRRQSLLDIQQRLPLAPSSTASP